MRGSILRRHMQKFFKISLASLLLLLALPYAHAQDEEPLRPRKPIDTWSSTPATRSKSTGRSKTAITCTATSSHLRPPPTGSCSSDARLPAGEAHEDEYFGKQQVFREHFYVSVPYQVDGERPESHRTDHQESRLLGRRPLLPTTDLDGNGCA